VLLENPGHENHWVGLKLIGVKSNRPAMGARVRVVLSDRSVYRTVNSGSSFGDTPFELHVGVGEASAIERIEIQWPAGGKQTLSGLLVDRVYQVREGEAKATVRNIKAFAYPHTQHAHH
jgi:hypothetical protein